MAKKNETTAMETYGAGDLPGVGSVAENPTIRENAIKNGRMAPMVHSIEEGKFIRGLLVGEGPLLEVNPDADGEAREPLKTWLMELSNGVRLSVISSHQLDRDLPPFIGRPVYIERGAQKSVGAKRVNQFLVIDESPKAGN